MVTGAAAGGGRHATLSRSGPLLRVPARMPKCVEDVVRHGRRARVVTGLGQRDAQRTPRPDDRAARRTRRPEYAPQIARPRRPTMVADARPQPVEHPLTRPGAMAERGGSANSRLRILLDGSLD